MIKKADNEKIEEYYRTDRLSQSKLKKLDKSIGEIKKELDKTKENIVIGSLVDDLLFSSNNDFRKKYRIGTSKVPTAGLKNLIDEIFKNELEVYRGEHEDFKFSDDSCFSDNKDNTDIIINVAEKIGFGKSYKNDTLIKKVLAFKDYYKDLVVGLNAIVITQEQYDKAKKIVESVKTSPYTRHYFSKDIESRSDTSVFYQFPIYFRYKGVKCKALLDMLILVFSDQGVISKAIPIDLKTTGEPLIYFNRSLVKFRYDIQAKWYSLALEHYLSEVLYDEHEVGLNTDNVQDIIQPFRFIVVNTEEPYEADVLEVDDSVYEMAEYGDNYRKSIDTLLKYHSFYAENGYLKEYDLHRSDHDFTKPLKIGVNGFSQ